MIVSRQFFAFVIFSSRLEFLNPREKVWKLVGWVMNLVADQVIEI